jgi:peptide/nickel transport system permease protein
VSQRWHPLLRSGGFLTGVLIIVFWTGCALLGRVLAPFDPFADDILSALSPPSAMCSPV